MSTYDTLGRRAKARRADRKTRDLRHLDTRTRSSASTRGSVFAITLVWNDVDGVHLTVIALFAPPGRHQTGHLFHHRVAFDVRSSNSCCCRSSSWVKTFRLAPPTNVSEDTYKDAEAVLKESEEIQKHLLAQDLADLEHPGAPRNVDGPTGEEIAVVPGSTLAKTRRSDDVKGDNRS